MNKSAGIAADDVRTTIAAWRAVLPVQGTEDGDLSAGLDAVKKHGLASGMRCYGPRAQRAGMRHLLAEDLQDSFESGDVRRCLHSGNERLPREIAFEAAKLFRCDDDHFVPPVYRHVLRS
jgi:hypothetical protein